MYRAEQQAPFPVKPRDKKQQFAQFQIRFRGRSIIISRALDIQVKKRDLDLHVDNVLLGLGEPGPLALVIDHLQ